MANQNEYGMLIATGMIAMSVLSSLVYVFTGDWHRALYWFFAAGITTVVTF